MKKILALSMALVLLSSSLTACSSKTDKASPEAKKQETSQSASNGKVPPPKDYPSKNIEFVVPAAAGATLDILVRGLNNSGLDLTKPLAISNMPGASQTLGLAEVASRKPNGLTLSCAGAAGTLIQPMLMKVSYKMEDYRYISMLNAPIANSVAISAKSNLKSWEDISKKIKAGETVKYTTSNTGSVAHLAALELMNQLGATSAKYVSYNGSAEANTALLSGDVDFLVNDVDLNMQREKDGQFKVVLVLDKKHSEYAPNVPTSEEVGIKGMENFLGMSWIVIPAKTPDEIVNWVKQQLDEAVGSQKFKDFLKTINKEPTPVVSEKELTKMLYDARDAYSKVIDKIKAK